MANSHVAWPVHVVVDGTSVSRDVVPSGAKPVSLGPGPFHPLPSGALAGTFILSCRMGHLHETKKVETKDLSAIMYQHSLVASCTRAKNIEFQYQRFPRHMKSGSTACFKAA